MLRWNSLARVAEALHQRHPSTVRTSCSRSPQVCRGERSRLSGRRVSLRQERTKSWPGGAARVLRLRRRVRHVHRSTGASVCAAVRPRGCAGLAALTRHGVRGAGRQHTAAVRIQAGSEEADASWSDGHSRRAPDEGVLRPPEDDGLSARVEQVIQRQGLSSRPEATSSSSKPAYECVWPGPTLPPGQRYNLACIAHAARGATRTRRWRDER
jgi:hypothetical protein